MPQEYPYAPVPDSGDTADRMLARVDSVSEPDTSDAPWVDKEDTLTAGSNSRCSSPPAVLSSEKEKNTPAAQPPTESTSIDSMDIAQIGSEVADVLKAIRRALHDVYRISMDAFRRRGVPADAAHKEALVDAKELSDLLCSLGDSLRPLYKITEETYVQVKNVWVQTLAETLGAVANMLVSGSTDTDDGTPDRNATLAVAKVLRLQCIQTVKQRTERIRSGYYWMFEHLLQDTIKRAVDFLDWGGNDIVLERARVLQTLIPLYARCFSVKGSMSKELARIYSRHASRECSKMGYRSEGCCIS